MVDLEKIEVIINVQPPRNVKQLHVTLGHTGHYSQFIKAYAHGKIIKEGMRHFFGMMISIKA